MDKENKEKSPFGSSAFIITFLVILFFFVFTVGQGPKDEDTTADEHVEGQAPAEDLSLEDAFWKYINERQPAYEYAETDCLVDGTKFDLPISPKGSGNIAGGVATDMMAIAIRPDEESAIKPNFDLQQFEKKMGTCPDCGATYMDIDYYNAQSSLIENGIEKLSTWDLSSFLPALDAKESESWTSDVKSFVRYKTQQQAGFPHNELGFGALSGAYCSNFSAWYGKDFTIPSAAFYALAAAQIKVDLEQDLPANITGRSISAMVLGELYRLLGRSDDAEQWYKHARSLEHSDDAEQGSKPARSLKGLDANAMFVLEFCEGNLANGDFSLKRVPDLEGTSPPPIGWQIDFMLPNISAHIADERGEWAGMDDIGEIEARIISVISAGAG